MDEEEIKRQVTFGKGYKKPPKHSQFKKGQSGNPKGRPKTVADEFSFTDQRTLKILLDVADQVVTVRENGEVKYISRREAYAQSLSNKAIKGDPRALATVYALTMKGDVARGLHIKRENEFWQSYKNVEAEKLLEAKAKGQLSSQPLPHPDDIVIDHENGPRFIGPTTEQEQARLDHTIRLRDVLILQDALDRRSETRLNGEALTDPGGAELFAMMLEQFIPPRLRLPNWEWAWRNMKAEGLTKRELKKQLYARWRKLGTPVPRGFVFPNLGVVKVQIERRMAMAKDIQRLPAPDKMPRGEWERAAEKIISAHVGGD